MAVSPIRNGYRHRRLRYLHFCWHQAHRKSKKGFHYYSYCSHYSFYSVYVSGHLLAWRKLSSMWSDVVLSVYGVGLRGLVRQSQVHDLDPKPALAIRSFPHLRP